MSDGGRLQDLIEQVLEARTAGSEPDLARLCGGDERLRTQLEQALADLGRLPELFQERGDKDRWIGTVLSGRFALIEAIGAGAMGIVYRAEDRELGRDVAVKMLRGELLGGERMAQRLQREAEVLARIRAPNVITIHDRGVLADDRVFLVMELLDGATLTEFVEAANSREPQARLRSFGERVDGAASEGSDLRTVVGWIAQACDGVQAAHDAGVLHRDLKPSNLFVERGGRVVVLDFGISSSSAQATIGSGGSPLGTPAYMAPEQLSDGELDARTDVYGLAATLYHLVVGCAPFQGSVAHVLHEVARRDPEPADRVRPGLPLDLVAVIEKAMAKDPRGRYPNAAAFRADLVAWLEHRPVSARRLPWWRLAVRRTWRSVAVRAAVAMLLVTVATIGWWQWAAQAATRDRQQWTRTLEFVCPSVVNDLPATRATNTVRNSAAQLARLDELVALGVDDGVSLALRAVHRLDGGDLDGAAADVQRIADLGDAPFAVEVARRHRAGERLLGELIGEQPPDLGGRNDRFLAAVYAIRRGGAAPSWIGRVLDESGAVESPGFEDLRLLRSFHEAFSAKSPRDAFRAVILAGERIEGRRGSTSGIIRHAVANSMLWLERRVEALEVAHAGREACPDDYLFCLAEGSALLRLRQTAEALQLFDRALELQPSSVNSHRQRIEALSALGRLDEAEQAIVDAPWQLSRMGDVWRPTDEGVNLFERAMLESPGSRRDELLRAARGKFRAANALLGAEDSFEELLASCMLGESRSYGRLFQYAALQPLDADLLDRLWQVLPDGLSGNDVEGLKILLRTQSETLDGRDK